MVDRTSVDTVKSAVDYAESGLLAVKSGVLAVKSRVLAVSIGVLATKTALMVVKTRVDGAKSAVDCAATGVLAMSARVETAKTAVLGVSSGVVGVDRGVLGAVSQTTRSSTNGSADRIGISGSRLSCVRGFVSGCRGKASPTARPSGTRSHRHRDVQAAQEEELSGRPTAPLAIQALSV